MINKLIINSGVFKDGGDIEYDRPNGACKESVIVIEKFSGFVSSHFDIDHCGDPRSIISLVANDNSFRLELYREDNLYSPMQLNKFVSKLARIIHFKTKYDVYIDVVQGEGRSYWINMNAKKSGEPIRFSTLGECSIFVQRAYVKYLHPEQESLCDN